MKTRKTLLLLAILMIYGTTWAQFKLPSKEMATEISKRKLIVVLFEGSEICEEVNSIYKDIITKHWKFNSNIEFLLFNEAIEKLKTAKDDYVILNPIWSEYTETETMSIINDEKKTTSASTFVYSLDILNENVKKKETEYWLETLYRIPTLNPAINYTDIMFVIKQMNYRLEAALNGTNVQNKEYNINSVKSRTLLINDEMLIFDEKEIEKNYKYPYKVVTSDVIDKAVKEGSSEYVYLHTIFSTGFLMPMYALIETDKQTIVSIVAAGGIKAPKLQVPISPTERLVIIDQSKTYKLKPSYFKYFDSESGQKMNYRE